MSKVTLRCHSVNLVCATKKPDGAVGLFTELEMNKDQMLDALKEFCLYITHAEFRMWVETIESGRSA